MKKKWWVRCFQWKINILITFFIVIAFVFTVSGLLATALARHPESIERWVSRALKKPVHIQSIQTNWLAFSPTITFHNVVVKNATDQRSLIQIKRMTVSINILHSVLHWRFNTIHLSIKHLVFSLPGVYRSSRLLAYLKVQCRWNMNNTGFYLYVPTYQFSLMGLQGRGKFYLHVSPSGKSTIDFLSRYRLSRLAQLPRLIPDYDRSSALGTWLKQALNNEISPAYGGDRALEFPKKGSGRASAAPNAGGRKPKAGCRAEQDCEAKKGAQAPLGSPSARVSALWGTGRAGEIVSGNNLGRLRPSCLKGEVSDATVAYRGPIEAHPFRYRAAHLSAKFHVHDVSLRYCLGWPALSSLNATIRMNNRHVSAVFLNPILDGNRIDVLKASLDDVMHPVLRMDASLHTNINRFLALGNVPVALHVKGSVDFTKPLFPVESEGEINIMGRLLQFQVHAADSVWIILHYRPVIVMRLLGSNRDHHFKWLSGELYLGRKLPPEHPALPGFVIDGKMAHFNWETWQPFILSFVHEKDGAINIPEIFGIPLRYVALAFDQLDVYHQTIKHMHFKLIPRPHDWVFQMQSPEVAGTLFIPNYSGGTWAGSLDHLFIPKMKSNHSKKKRKPLGIDPRSLPPIDVDVKQFHYGKADYGHMTLRTRPTRHGMSIKLFSISAPLLTLKMQGNWNQNRCGQKTALRGHFQTNDLGRLLLDWDIKDTVLHGEGSSSFTVSWADALDQMTLKKLNGLITFDFQHGRILKIDDSEMTELSLGRIMNAFSLEALPRRLLFHFGDITENGLEFHTLKGKLKIKDGVSTIQNTLLDSPVAKLKISGVINFPGKYYNLNVSVSPYVTSSLPLIVGIAGGPIAGAIAWVANKIVSPEIGKMIGFVYHAKASWDTSKDQKLPAPAKTYNP